MPHQFSKAPPLATVIRARLDRRGFLKNASRFASVPFIPGAVLSSCASAQASNAGLGFDELTRGKDEYLHVPAGYEAKVVIGWGDAVLANAPRFDPRHQSPSAQERQFGYNNDFIAYLPLPEGTASSQRGLLCVNHEYTVAGLMFPSSEARSGKHMAIEQAAHGMSVVEVARVGTDWQIIERSRFARRIYAHTPMRLSGPAAGHTRLRTRDDPTGDQVLGTLSNCAGGTTPWGTVLSAEENFQFYFRGAASHTGSEAINHRRYGVGETNYYDWYLRHPRFDIESHPREPNRFGWVVELDPYAPDSSPVKRTALGRFRHEAATTVLNRDGRVVVYTGDDQAMHYIYRYVSHGRYRPEDPDSRTGLLDHGVLSVARFDEQGKLEWLALEYGAGPLTPEHGFHSQADVLIEARRAADLLRATSMDSPEDIETNPITGTVFVILTGNRARAPEQTDAPNPRSNNKHGHILELIPPGGRGADADHTAAVYDWQIALLCGNPGVGEGGPYDPATSEDGWFAAPDNCAFDNQGRLWITTDASTRGRFANGAWAMDVDRVERGLNSRLFLRCPRGAELCGPAFTPDDTTLFVAIQHPAQEPGSSFEAPTTRWPDFDPRLPPRPSVVAITRTDGGIIGS